MNDTLTFAARCNLATDCLPQAEYRTRLERLHGDMMAEIGQLRHAVAIMDTRDALGLCAPTEGDFPALYALKGRRVALVELGPNVRVDLETTQ